MKIIACVLPCLLLACPPSPLNPGPDADAQSPVDASSYAEGAPVPGTPEAACSALKTAGCPEGVTRISATLTPESIACMGRSTTKESARACGGVACK